MAKKTKEYNTARPTGKKNPFWLDPKASLALDFELVDALGKIILKNMHRTVFGISERLAKAGIFAHAIFDADPAKVGEVLELINRDIDAAKAFFFRPPAPSRDPRVREDAQGCKAALRSRLIFVGVLSEECALTAPGTKKHSQYLTLYAIFRKPKANACFVGILGIERRRAKNLADG